MARRNERAVSLGDGLRSIMSSMDKNGKLATAGVIEVWEHVTGPEIAAHTFITGLREGELLVLVDSPVWAAQLSAIQEQLKAKLVAQIGEGIVTSVRFTVSRRVGLEREERDARVAAKSGYAEEHVEPEKLSEQEMAAVERSVKTIENEELRNAVLRATITDLEWKKGQEKANSSQAAPGGLPGAK